MSTTLFERELTTFMNTVVCPAQHCTAPAYIEDRWTMESTDGPFEMVKLRCLDGCWYTLPAADV